MKKENTSTVRQSASRSSTSVARSSGASSSVGAPRASWASLAPASSPAGEWAQSVRLPGRFSRAVHQQHRSLPLAKVLAGIRGRVCRQWGFTEVVGQWVWVHSSDTLTSLERAWLFELGFHYSPRRRAWQHPCGIPSAPGRQPFAKYFPADQESQPLQFIPRF